MTSLICEIYIDSYIVTYENNSIFILLCYDL